MGGGLRDGGIEVAFARFNYWFVGIAFELLLEARHKSTSSISKLLMLRQ